MKIREMQARLQQSRGYKWWVLGMIMLGTFMAVLDVTVVNVGIPTIMSAFHIRISSAEWVITAYMITMTIMLPSAGWLADRYGNKKLYLGGMVIFTLGSWPVRAERVEKSRSGPFRLARMYLHCRIHAVDDLCAGPGKRRDESARMVIARGYRLFHSGGRRPCGFHSG